MGQPYVDDETYRKVQTEIALLRKQVADLAEMWEDLIKTARDELKGASVSINRYEM